jgi:hypothetical protein
LAGRIIGLFLFIGGCASVGPQPPPQSSLRDSAIDLQHAIARALVAGDDAFLDRTYADHYTYVAPFGVVRTKQEVLSGRARGQARTLALEYDDLAVRLYGPVAVVTGRATASVEDHGRTTTNRQSRFVRVQVLRDGHWQVVHYQVTWIEAG